MTLPPTCPTCHGPRDGRGYRHADGCHAKPPATGTPRARRAPTRADGTPYSEGRPQRRVPEAIAAQIDEAAAQGREDELFATYRGAWEGICAR